MGSHRPFNCHDVQLCAAALLDEQLSPAEEELVSQHLEHCEPCADLLDAMDAQRLKPPRLQILQDDDYWQEMDAVLQAELERSEIETAPTVSKKMLFVYAAAMLLTFFWGWQQRQRAVYLERIVYTQQQTLEQLERSMITTQSSHPVIPSVESSTIQKVSHRPTKREL